MGLLLTLGVGRRQKLTLETRIWADLTGFYRRACPSESSC